MTDQNYSSNIDVIESPLKRITGGELQRISRLVRQRGIDVIHTHQTRAHTFGVLLKMRTGVPVIATAHHRRIHLHWRLNDFVIANSQATYDFHRRVSRVSRAKMKTVYCFSDLERFHSVQGKKIPKIRNTHRLGPDDFLICVAGQVAPRKGHDVLFEALPQLIEKIPNLKVLLVGRFGRRQKYVKQLRSFLIEKNLIGRVKWAGYRSNVAEYMAASQMVVVPSIEEPLGLVALEAMAAGTPVVATGSGGLAEIVLDGQTGLSVKPGDASALAQAILRLAKDPGLANELVAGGSRFVRENFETEPLVDQVELVYDMILRRRQAA